jgi:uridine kinase
MRHSKRAEIPIYSFAKHAREEKTTSIYSPHVLILEGIFALYDPRVLELLDMKVFFHGAAYLSNLYMGYYANIQFLIA